MLPGLLLLFVLGAVPRLDEQLSDAPFYVDAVCVRAQSATSGARVDVYTRVPYRLLQFISDGTSFRASYSVSVTVFEADGDGRRGRVVRTASWTRTATAPSFGAAQSPSQSDLALGSLTLAPGRYTFAVRMQDAETNRSFVQDLPVQVRDMSRPVAMSDLILIEGYDERRSSITPLVASSVPTTHESFKFFYEVYAARAERVRVHREVLRVNKSSGSRSLRNIFGLVGGDEEAAEVTYTRAEPTALRAGRTPFVVEIPMGELQAGEYRLRVRVEDASGRVLDVAERSVTAVWAGLEEHIRDIDQAIAQLGYIAKSKELAHIRAGRTANERLTRFRQFWEKRDPTPGTERNERMEEYYYRISFANSRYSDLTDGWRTDRGQVLVLFGEPDRVDRHTQASDERPYEVWYYNRIGRRFIFVDESGRGEFKLLIPIWDERNRLK